MTDQERDEKEGRDYTFSGQEWSYEEEKRKKEEEKKQKEEDIKSGKISEFEKGDKIQPDYNVVGKTLTPFVLKNNGTMRGAAYTESFWDGGKQHLTGKTIVEKKKMTSGDYLGWFYSIGTKNVGETKTLYFSQAQLNAYDAFDTGGYTGEWDSSGRLAVLHQKELVLNAADTSNILNAVTAVRDIASMVGSAIKGNVYSMLIEKIGGIAVGAPWARESNDNARQNVFHITAEFPNADSVATIQEAILSLPNIASQYITENIK